MRAVRAFEPKLAKAIENVATDLANRPAAEQKQILDLMKQMYDGMNPLKSDNRESAEALRKAKLNPEYVDGVKKRAEELLKLPEDQRAKALQTFQKQFREFYLD
jgi:predicted RND superfamily exporter protein